MIKTKWARKFDLLWVLCSGMIFFAFMTLPSTTPAGRENLMMMAFIGTFVTSVLSYLAKKIKRKKSLAAWANAFAITSYLYVLMWDVINEIPVIGGFFASDLWFLILFPAIFIVAKKKRLKTGWITLTLGALWSVLLFQAFHTSLETYDFYSYHIREVTLIYGGLVGFVSLFSLRFRETRQPVRIPSRGSNTRVSVPTQPRQTPVQSGSSQPTSPKPPKGDKNKTQSVKSGSKDNSKINF